MANINTLSPFNFGTHPVRVILRNDEPWFVATDICLALGYKNTTKAIGDHLDDDERAITLVPRTPNDSLGVETNIINESGLYALVLRSRKPEARKFAKWVTSEVLPSIRKTGSYNASSEAKALALQKEQRLAQAKIDVERILTDLYQPLVKHLTEHPFSQPSQFRLSRMTRYDGYTTEKFVAQV